MWSIFQYHSTHDPMLCLPLYCNLTTVECPDDIIPHHRTPETPWSLCNVSNRILVSHTDIGVSHTHAISAAMCVCSLLKEQISLLPPTPKQTGSRLENAHALCGDCSVWHHQCFLLCWQPCFLCCSVFFHTLRWGWGSISF